MRNSAARKSRLTEREFAKLIKIPPARGPNWSTRVAYAHAVLVLGRRPADVAKEQEVSRQAVSRAANYFLSLQEPEES